MIWYTFLRHTHPHCNQECRSLDKITIGPLAIDTKLDDTHYLLKDVTGRTLPGDYHINRIKRAKEVMPDGLADTYEQLRNQIGLLNDTCATPQKSSAAQLRIK